MTAIENGFPPAERMDVGGGVSLSVHAAGPKNAPLVILLHGWPELALSWKRQIPAIAGVGFRVLAPDGRGVGGSDAPTDVSAYGIDQLVGDIEGLIDREGAQKAVVVGHDMGGMVAWAFAMLRPERTAGVAALCTPHLPRGQHPPVAAARGFGGEDHYIVRFQEPGLAESLFDPSAERFFDFIFTPFKGSAYVDRTITHILKQFEAFDSAVHTASAVPAADRKIFVEAYERSGFAGVLNWYRNLDANWARMANVDQVVRAPSLMISAEHDPILPPDLTRWMDQLTPDLEKHVIPGVGHWIQWEAPDAVNAHLTGWLRRRFGAR